MNILMLVGRGVEGTGQTRTAIEIHNYFKKNGHDITTIANTEKKWGRAKSQEHEMIDFNFKKGVYESDTKFDKVIIASVPASNYSEEGKDNFLESLKRVSENAQVSYVQVDHKIQSISRNFYRKEKYLKEFFDCIDIIVTHDKDNDFCQKFLKRFVEKEIQIEEMMFISGDFDNIERASYKDKIKFKNTFIGRSAAWKGWTVLRDFHHDHLKEAGYITSIEGIELSVGILGLLYVSTKPERIARSDVQLMFNQDADSVNDGSFKGKEALIFGPYIRKDALRRMRESTFGFFFTYIGDQYGGPIENTLMEIIGSGTVPVVRKELFESAKYINGRLSDFAPAEVGMIVYDPENPTECLRLMNELNEDEGLYNLYSDRACDWAVKNFNQNHVIGNFAKILEKNEKRS